MYPSVKWMTPLRVPSQDPDEGVDCGDVGAVRRSGLFFCLRVFMIIHIPSTEFTTDKIRIRIIRVVIIPLPYDTIKIVVDRPFVGVRPLSQLIPVVREEPDLSVAGTCGQLKVPVHVDFSFGHFPVPEGYISYY